MGFGFEVDGDTVPALSDVPAPIAAAPCLGGARRGICHEARAVRAEPSHNAVAGQVMENDGLRL